MQKKFARKSIAWLLVIGLSVVSPVQSFGNSLYLDKTYAGEAASYTHDYYYYYDTGIYRTYGINDPIVGTTYPTNYGNGYYINGYYVDGYNYIPYYAIPSYYGTTVTEEAVGNIDNPYGGGYYGYYTHYTGQDYNYGYPYNGYPYYGYNYMYPYNYAYGTYDVVTIPLADLATSIGADSYTADKNNAITIKVGNCTITAKVGSNIIVIDGESFAIEDPAGNALNVFIHDGVIYFPYHVLPFIAEVLGIKPAN